MAINEAGEWSPDLFPKQLEALQACQPGKQNLILFNGPRWASKTWTCHHVAIQHAWNTDRADICILTITQSVGLDSGVWQHLTDTFIPEWIGGEDHEGKPFGGRFGMEWVRQPYIQNVTKKPSCSVTNKFGTKSQFSLQSLSCEDDVELKFKSKAYSMIWVNEMSKFKKRQTFDTLKQCLRMPHLTTEQHLFLGDTNPDLQLGTASPWYQLWYGLATMEDCPGYLIPLRDQLKLIEFTIDDNLSLSEEKKAQLRADFGHDPDLMAAYYYGKWVTASADALFYGVFKPNIHVIGDYDSPAVTDPEILVPDDNCDTIICGLDPGVRNSAAAFLEKRILVRDGREIPAFSWIDELVIINDDFDLADYVRELVRKMEFWENVLKKPRKLTWRWWSDRSVFDTKLPFSGELFWHNAIYELSDGRITCMAAERGRGSVGVRVDLFRKILYEDRLRISANKVPHGIQMVRSIRRGKSAVSVIERTSPWKHSFDSVSYAITSECCDELQRNVISNVKRKSEVGLVQVSL